eukprot:Em0019g863a
MAKLFRLLIVFIIQSCLGQCYTVVHEATAKVAGGEAKYYTYQSKGVFVVFVTTTEGDADLFAAPSSLTKTPDADKYLYTSASCGQDVLAISESGEVSIGVYGHIRHDSTTYQLYIIQPDINDINKYQIWEKDHETGRNELVIDVDPLVVANDPELHKYLTSITDHGLGSDVSITSILQPLGELAVLLLRFLDALF